jgi:DNA-3-methyladenine glycosylase I
VQNKTCAWAVSELMLAYHDKEWGVPLHDEHALFEFLILEGAQAGLSWEIILTKRDNFRSAMDRFDPEIVAQYDSQKIESLLSNPGIIRNRRKIEAAVINARSFLRVQKEFGSFDTFLWQLVGHQPIKNRWRLISEIPSQTPKSIELSQKLKSRGFKFVGPTICYALMQAVGIVNDHTTDCFRYDEIG